MVKPDAKPWIVQEQIIEDPVTKLTLQFEVAPDGTPRLHIFGEALPFGNRDLVFDAKGDNVGAGTATRGLCRPAWLTQVEGGDVQ